MARTIAERGVRVRATVFTGVSALLAFAAHTAGQPGPAHLDLSILIGGAGTIGFGVAGLCRQQRSFGAVLAALVASQVAFHLLFLLTMHTDTSASKASGAPLLMVGGHLVLAILATAILTGGDAAFRTFTSLWGRVTALLSYRLRAAGSMATSRPMRPAQLRPATFLLRHRFLRGPPAFAV